MRLDPSWPMRPGCGYEASTRYRHHVWWAPRTAVLVVSQSCRGPPDTASERHGLSCLQYNNTGPVPGNRYGHRHRPKHVQLGHIPVNRSRYRPTYLSRVSWAHLTLHTLFTSVAKLRTAAWCSSVPSGSNSSTCTYMHHVVHLWTKIIIVTCLHFVSYNLQICE